MLQRPWFALAGDPAELGCHTGSDPLKSQGTRCQREPVGTGPWSLQFVTNITGHELPALGTARPPLVVTLREKHVRGEEQVSGSKQTARACANLWLRPIPIKQGVIPLLRWVSLASFDSCINSTAKTKRHLSQAAQATKNTECLPWFVLCAS